jgi:hypothetical protein
MFQAPQVGNVPIASARPPFGAPAARPADQSIEEQIRKSMFAGKSRAAQQMIRNALDYGSTSPEAKMIRKQYADSVAREVSARSAQEQRELALQMRIRPAEIMAEGRRATAQMSAEQKEADRIQKQQQFEASHTQRLAEWQGRVANWDAQRKHDATMHEQEYANRAAEAQKNRDFESAQVIDKYGHDERMVGLNEESKRRLMLEDARLAEERGDAEEARAIHKAVAIYAGQLGVEAAKKKAEQEKGDVGAAMRSAAAPVEAGEPKKIKMDQAQVDAAKIVGSFKSFEEAKAKYPQLTLDIFEEAQSLVKAWKKQKAQARVDETDFSNWG